MTVFRFLGALVSAALFFSFSLTLPVAAEDGQRVILILDGSGSMRGKIDGKAKIDIAKEVVGKTIANWKPEDEIGLVVYGHRQKGACNDIETLVEPGPLDAKTFMDKVKAISPKGKTPMTEAVRQAAKALEYTEKKATIILVSDGIETCEADPCAVAGELASSGVGLTIHTVGFGLDDTGAVAQLKCLADKTGGLAIIAENADELRTALAKTVAATPEAKPAPEPAEPGKNVTGNVELAAGVPLPTEFSSPTWEFSKAADGQKGETVATEYGVKVKTSLPVAGDYIVRIVNDTTAIETPFTVEDGKRVELALTLESGIIHFKGMMDEETAIAAEGTAWELINPNGDVVATKYGAEAAFLAPAGSYKIRLSKGDARVEQDTSIVAGKTGEQEVTLGAGIVEASALFSAGGEKAGDGVAIELLEGEAALDGSRKSISTQYLSVSQFNVPAGKYVVKATADYATASQEIEVKAGAVTKVAVVLNGGYLSLSAPGAGQIAVYEGKKQLNGERRYITYEYSDKLNRAFNAGTYYVEALDANGTVLSSKEFEVKAGERTEGTIP